MSEWQGIERLSSHVAEHHRATGNYPEFLIALPSGEVRVAAWGLGTIMVGCYGGTLPPSDWPTHFMPLPAPPAV